MKKRTQSWLVRWISLVLMLGILCPVGVSAEGVSEKYPSYLPDDFSGADTVEIMIHMTLSGLPCQDQEAFSAAVLENLARWGLSEKELLMSPSDAWYCVNWQQRLGKVSEEKRLPVVAMKLTKEEFLALAEQDDVAYMEWYHNAGICYQNYTAEDALRILQHSVKLVSISNESEAWRLNIDQKGKIDAADALLALQEAVGLVTVAYPPGTEMIV